MKTDIIHVTEVDARDLNSTRLPSVLARFSYPGEGSLRTRLVHASWYSRLIIITFLGKLQGSGLPQTTVSSSHHEGVTAKRGRTQLLTSCS